MIRVGAVDIDTSHPVAFAEILKNSGRARYTAVYNRGFRSDDEVEGFIKKFELEKRCSSLDELVESVDIGFIHSCNWNKHVEYAKPFIDAGKPVFIDKPLAGNPADLLFLEKAASSGGVILGSSSARYAFEIDGFNARAEESAGDVLHVFGSCGVDEFNYGVHIVEAIGGILGTGAGAVRFCGRASGGDKFCETYFVSYKSGASAVYSNFTGTHHPFEIIIMGSKNTCRFTIDTAKIYRAMLEKVIDYMETKENGLAGINALTESIKIMLAGKLSRERGGEEVLLDSIPPDYSGFDGRGFEEKYSEKARKFKF